MGELPEPSINDLTVMGELPETSINDLNVMGITPDMVKAAIMADGINVPDGNVCALAI